MDETESKERRDEMSTPRPPPQKGLLRQATLNHVPVVPLPELAGQFLEAVETCNTNMTKELVRRIPRPQLIDMATWKDAQNNPNCDTPLHRAAMKDHIEAARLLWPFMGDMSEIQNVNQQAPINIAASVNSYRVVDFFIGKRKTLLDQRDGVYKRTPLHQASNGGHIDIVKQLVEKFKADVYAKSGPEDDEDLPIHLAAHAGHLAVVEYFLTKFPDLVDAKDKDGNRPIHKASLGGRDNIVDYLISKRGVPVDLRQDSHGRTSLHQAAEKGRLNLVMMLVEKFKASLSAKSIDSHSAPIHLAAAFGKLDVVHYFLQKSIRLLDATDKDGDKPIHMATLGGQCNVVEYLIEKRNVPVDLKQGSHGRTPLHQAAQQGHLDMSKMLVEKYKADIFAKSDSNDDEQMPIHLAANFGRLAVVQYFLEQNPDLINAEDKNGDRPLHKAVLAGRINLVEYFLTEKGENVNLPQTSLGRTSLHLAANKGRLDVVQVLTDKYNADLYARSNSADSEQLPIHIAAYFGHLPVVEFFLGQNSDLIDARDVNGDRPIHKAALAGRINVVDYFISNRGVNVDLPQDSGGRTPLHLAANKGHLDLVKLLVDKHNASVYKQSTDTESLAIHYAAYYGHLQIVEYFLDRWPDLLTCEDAQGNRPIHSAALGGRTNVIDYLIAKKEVDAELRQSSFGRTALHIAAYRGHFELTKLLIEQFRADVLSKSYRIDLEVTPLHLAAWQGRLAVVQYLVETYPDLPSVKDFTGKTPVMLAMKSGDLNEAEQVVTWLKTRIS